MSVNQGLVETACRAALRAATDTAQLADYCNEVYAKACDTYQHGLNSVNTQVHHANSFGGHSSRGFFSDQCQEGQARIAQESVKRATSAINAAQQKLQSMHVHNTNISNFTMEVKQSMSAATDYAHSKQPDIEGVVEKAVIAAADAARDAAISGVDFMNNLNEFINASGYITKNEMDSVVHATRFLSQMTTNLGQIIQRVEVSSNSARDSGIKLAQAQNKVQVTQIYDHSVHDSRQFVDKSSHQNHSVSIQDSVVTRPDIGGTVRSPSVGENQFREMVKRAIMADGIIGTKERDLIDWFRTQQNIDIETAHKIETEIIDDYQRKKAENSTHECPKCKSPVLPRWKLCPECGTALGN